jgi:hypothetical protein
LKTEELEQGPQDAIPAMFASGVPGIGLRGRAAIAGSSAYLLLICEGEDDLACVFHAFWSHPMFEDGLFQGGLGRDEASLWG